MTPSTGANAGRRSTHARNGSQRQRAGEAPRQGHGPAAGAGWIGRRHGARVVRLLHLRHGRRARLRRPVLQRQGRHRRGDARRLRHLRRRLRGAPARRDPVRQHGRPHRPPRDADRHDAADGHLDRHHRPAAHLREHRPLGADPADAHARLPGPGRRRRVRRRVDPARRACAQAQARLLRLVQPARRADRPRARHRGVPARQPAAGGPAQRVGLAAPVPGLVPDDLRDALLPPAGGGVAGLRGASRAPRGREAADHRDRQAVSEERAGRHRRARRRRRGDLHLRLVHASPTPPTSSG